MPKKVRIIFLILLIAGVTGGGWYYRHQEAPVDTHTLTLYGNVDIREVQPYSAY